MKNGTADDVQYHRERNQQRHRVKTQQTGDRSEISRSPRRQCHGVQENEATEWPEISCSACKKCRFKAPVPPGPAVNAIADGLADSTHQAAAVAMPKNVRQTATLPPEQKTQARARYAVSDDAVRERSSARMQTDTTPRTRTQWEVVMWNNNQFTDNRFKNL